MSSVVAPGADAEPTGLREDIQILRGFAVLVVVLFHVGLPGLRAGYLGVDIFFVISGFLMMRMLAADQDAGRLSIPRFYLRRARRLLPAALATIAVTSTLGVFVMARWDWDDYVSQALGALTFTANIVAWVDGQDYFGAAAETKPLLHFWSLSLEEQFYLLLPFGVLLAGRRYRLPLIVLAAFLSLAACLVIAPGHRAAAFFLLPTRAWELLLGAAVAGALVAWPRLRVGWRVQAAGAVFIVALPFVPLDPVHPRFDALLVCLGTAAILLGADRGPATGLAGRLLGRIGDISYSLYLVHWPLLAFATIAYLGTPPPLARTAIVVASLALAALQFRFVETPFRRPRPGRRRTLVFAAGSAAVAIAIATGIALQANVVQDGRMADVRARNVGLGAECDYETPTFTPVPECQTATSPATALWGDSYMMQWGGALRDLPGGIIQITRSSCVPVIGLVADPGPNDWLQRCFAFHQTAFDAIIAAPWITTVVISAHLWAFTVDGTARLADTSRVAASSTDAARIAFGETIRALEAADKRVVVIASAAASGRDIGACLERIATGLLVLGRTGCDFAVEEQFAYDAAKTAFLEAIAVDTGVTIIWPAAGTCDATTCRTTIDGLPLYRDSAHMTNVAAPLIAERLHLADIITGEARCTADPADAEICVLLRRPVPTGAVAP